MRISGFRRGRLLLAALGVLLFALVFLSAFLYTLPKGTILSPLESAFASRGIGFSCEDAGIAFPFRLVCRNAVLVPAGGGALSLDSLEAAWEWTGLLQWLPVRLTATRGEASLTLRTSPMVSNPGKVQMRLAKIGSEDLAALFSGTQGHGFRIEDADIRWKRSASGQATGAGEGSLAWLRFPIPAQNSPVRDALLSDVRLKFVVREGTLHVSSLTGTYEGSAVDGTGEIARFLTPSRSAINFHLRIRNPLEGKIAILFNMMAKNAKNANLRVGGTLLSPTGEFQFF